MWRETPVGRSVVAHTDGRLRRCRCRRRVEARRGVVLRRVVLGRIMLGRIVLGRIMRRETTRDAAVRRAYRRCVRNVSACSADGQPKR